MILPQKKYHICLILDEWFPLGKRQVGQYGGTQVHVRELKKYLELKHNCQVVLFYQSHPSWLIKLLWPLIVLVDVILYNRYHHLHLIHVHGIRSAPTAKLLSLILKIPVVQTVHSLPHTRFEKIIDTQIPYTTQITISSNFTRYPNVNLNPRVIRNGVNLADFNYVKVKKHSYPNLIWVGKDDLSKGLEYLKNAILKVRKIYPDFQAELVTNGRLSGKELIKAYKRAHVFVLSSLTESQPITLLEAWAARLPVVVTNVGDNGLMVKNNRNGFLVDPANSKQLADAILVLLKSKTKAIRFGEAGYQYVKENYSWARVAKETYEVYQYALTLFSHSEKTSKSKIPANTSLITDR